MNRRTFLRSALARPSAFRWLLQSPSPATDGALPRPSPPLHGTSMASFWKPLNLGRQRHPKLHLPRRTVEGRRVAIVVFRLHPARSVQYRVCGRRARWTDKKVPAQLSPGDPRTRRLPSATYLMAGGRSGHSPPVAQRQTPPYSGRTAWDHPLTSRGQRRWLPQSRARPTRPVLIHPATARVGVWLRQMPACPQGTEQGAPCRRPLALSRQLSNDATIYTNCLMARSSFTPSPCSESRRPISYMPTTTPRPAPRGDRYTSRRPAL